MKGIFFPVQQNIDFFFFFIKYDLVCDKRIYFYLDTLNAIAKCQR